MDTEYGRTPLAWAALSGYGGVLKALLEQDVCTSTLDNINQSPLSLALSKGHDEVIRILRGNANSCSTGHGGQAPLPPPPLPPSPLPSSAEDADGRAVDIQSRSHVLNTDITDLTTAPTLSSANLDERDGVFDPEGPLPKSADSDLSSTEPPMLPPPISSRLLKSSSPPGKSDNHPHNTRSTPSLALDRYFLIASFICLLAFLVYILPSQSSHILTR